ncbi:MAG: hypothetical protein LBC30_03265, partial [Puniceicoccales bacterium]|nr:hypothetical protein [Puniceicoccales bacterium]
GKVIISTGESSGIYGATATTYSANKDLAILFPVGAAYAFRMFNSNLTVNIFRFIYAKGALVGA